MFLASILNNSAHLSFSKYLITVGTKIFYWNPIYVCGSDEAKTYATVVAVHKRHEWRKLGVVKLNNNICLTWSDRFRVMYPYKTKNQIDLSECDVVPGCLPTDQYQQISFSAAIARDVSESAKRLQSKTGKFACFIQSPWTKTKLEKAKQSYQKAK